MRRIYESGALDRDDEDPFRPNDRDVPDPQAMRTVPGATISRALIPHWIRHRCIGIRIRSPRSAYPVGSQIPFIVTMKNVAPFPISIPTKTLRRWNWYVDGHPAASLIDVSDPPQEESSLDFGRGERKQFHRRWDQMFRESRREWVPAEPGEYTISARVNIDAPESKGLADAITVRITDD